MTLNFGLLVRLAIFSGRILNGFLDGSYADIHCTRITSNTFNVAKIGNVARINAAFDSKEARCEQ
jgi:hypothetical protein